MVDGVMQRRWAVVQKILGQMPQADGHRLTEVLNQFAETGGELPERDLWSVGRTIRSHATPVT